MDKLNSSGKVVSFNASKSSKKHTANIDSKLTSNSFKDETTTKINSAEYQKSLNVLKEKAKELDW